MARIYLASSWRNEAQPDMVRWLRAGGHEVYDFRNPMHREKGFSWLDTGMHVSHISPRDYRDRLLTHPAASHGFLADFRAMEWADTFICLLPCGRSAHLELGWACGRGKRTIVYIPADLTKETGFEPELMYLCANKICVEPAELAAALGDFDHP